MIRPALGKRHLAFGMLAALLALAAARSAEGLDFPGPEPGPARSRSEASDFTLENEILKMTWSAAQGRFRPVSLADKISGKTLSLEGSESFRVVLAASPSPRPRIVTASELKVVEPPRVELVKPDGQRPRLAERLGGAQLVARLVSPEDGLDVQWWAILRDGANYVQQGLTLTATKEPREVRELVLWDAAAPGARVAGAVDGSPVSAGTLFFGVEHPMAKSEVFGPALAGRGNAIRCTMPCNSLLRPGEPLAQTWVVGIAPEGQLRRAFLSYLERERAHPYRPFLHYNNGSEIGCEYWARKLSQRDEEARQFRRNQEQIWLTNIRAFGEELVAKRQAAIDGFAHDFEWDDESLVWQFHEGYPRGFAPARETAARYQARVGVWLSPAGGYPGKPARLQSGRTMGFETGANGFSSAGPRYYARLRTVCANMVRQYGVNYFKFDGFGAGNNEPGAGPYASDVEALLRLMTDLRGLDPEVFFNPSTGTWPSPFWLKYADSIWRQGSDTSVLGKGSQRQQWITYRDSEILHGVLDRSPLYPINSLMIHGVFINRLPLFGNPYDPKAQRPTYDPAEITAEIRSFFGTGTGLQELYIAPELMTPETWDVLAEAARWSRANADVLVDTHWIGGDPAKGQVYGWASWSRRKAILTLRNPGDAPAEFTLDLGKAFELPKQAPQALTLKSPWKEDAQKPPRVVSAGRPHPLALKPFEVLVLEATPAAP